MLEYFLRSAYWLARARSSPVGSYLDGFAAALREIGYCKRIGTWCITYAVHLGIWATAEDVRIRDLDEETVSAFLAHLSRCRCPGNRAGFHAVARPRTWVFVQYLRTVGVVAVPGQQAIATPDLVTGFCEWMRRQRGVADTTLRHYRRVAIALLGHLGDDPARYGAGVLRAAVREVAGGHGAATAKQVATVARAFLRYLAVEGRCRPGLDAAVLPVASWSLGSLPRYVSAEVVQRIIDACDSNRPDGARDRAILLLLARLGLRGGDIVRMRLGDIDWANARVQVAGKGRREVRLPLPQEVGDAILAYLRARRAVVGCDWVFLRSRAPWRPLAESSCVSCIVKRAIARAGVSAPTRGAHLLRHSAATAMLREGISLPSIGIVLRHRSVETTSHYAKVDVELLRSVAQPWIGGASC
jgi:site-specific recombinase XerD